MKIAIRKDKYRKTRGGYSRILNLSCENCKVHICNYQKDGPGILKRLYLDRISESKKYSGLESNPIKEIPNLICDKCNKVLGVPYIYDKEKRLSFRLFVGAIHKKIIKNV